MLGWGRCGVRLCGGKIVDLGCIRVSGGYQAARRGYGSIPARGRNEGLLTSCEPINVSWRRGNSRK